MSTASISFLAFSAIAALLYHLARPVWWRTSVLLIGNFYFLSTFSPGVVSLMPMLAFVVVSYAGIRIVQAAPSSRSYWPIMALVLASFFWLKKYWFLGVFGFLDTPYATIGLSYMLFRAVHLLIDARGGDLPDRIHPVAYANYLLNFTTLVSGPIQRYQEFAAQLSKPRASLSFVIAGRAVERIVRGLLKMIVFAQLAFLVHARAADGLSAPVRLDELVWMTLVAIVSYTVFLYFNFSGYTDIVIGIARFFGLELPENFNRPFSARNFMEFWTRWHMSLSNWFKIYLYNPMLKALMRRFPSPSIEPFLGVACFTITFFLIGLWHGQTSIFALYGLILGLGVSCNKLYQIVIAKLIGRPRYRALASNPVYRALACGLTFTWLSLSSYLLLVGLGKDRRTDKSIGRHERGAGMRSHVSGVERCARPPRWRAQCGIERHL